MSSDTESPDPAAQSMPEWVDQVADRFDAAWRHGPPPRIADFLAAEDGPRRRALVEELIKIDLECRWTAGDLRPVEDYTRELPELIGPDGSLPDELVLYASQMRSRFAPETTQDVQKPESARPLLTSAQDIRC
ncbi:MAG: hypothetical protein HYS13_16380, partial [Planctomycetia bacterium]|nr:hypothetical protein [Planctomycetia bacterium]